MKDANSNNFLQTIFSQKKYKPFLVSAGLFLALNVGVLIPTLFVSALLKKDAVSINLAGRQRMLSQKMSKSLLGVKEKWKESNDFKQSQEELRQAYELFDDAFEGFKRGKSVEGADGNRVYLKAVETQRGREILQEASEIWEPYKEKLQPIIKADKSINLEDLQPAVNYTRENNLKLLALMNELTIEQEKVAQTKTGYLQLIQLAGITLA